MHQTNSYGLDAVNVSFLDPKNKILPLVISPRWDDSLEFLSKWLEKNRPWVDGHILLYGAVLIRGFRIDSAKDFERATLSLQPNLCDAYRGTSPRSVKEGTKYAFSAADVPVNYPIAQHLEMSFLTAPPRQLYFGCLEASKRAGGETALCDFRKVHQDLSPELRQKFETKKIKYTRKHFKTGEKFTYDVGAMLGWPELYGTADPKEVEVICQEEDAPKVRWVGPNNDTFLQEWIDDPCQRHPDTKELVWFNHSQVFHWTTFSAELWYAFLRIKDFHLLNHFIMISIFTFIKYGLLGYKMALNTTFGDGTPISLKEMNQVRAAIHKNMVFSRWQKGDILCIDNFSTSHGRQPTYDKGRQVIVAWSQPRNKTMSPTPEFVAVSVEKDDGLHHIIEDHSLPELVAESPDSSPESTLTREEAKVLKEALLSNRFEEQMAMAFSKREESKLHHKRLASCPNLLGDGSGFWRVTAGKS